MARDTGLPSADAQFDFSRARRRRALARLTARLRRVDDVNLILPFEEVVSALGRVGERRLGLQVIPLDSIVGTVDRCARVRPRLPPHLARGCARAGSGSTPPSAGARRCRPIDVYRIGELHFVKDGHHRVSVARALGHKDIEAYVTEVHDRARRRVARSASRTCR